MNHSKCEICGKPVSHCYHKKDLCELHYWFERGKPTTVLFVGVLKSYQNSHPIIMKRWREQYPELDKLLKREEDWKNDA